MVCMPDKRARSENRNQQKARWLKREASPAMKKGGKREKFSGMDRARLKGSGKDHRKWAGECEARRGERASEQAAGKGGRGLLSSTCCLWS